MRRILSHMYRNQKPGTCDRVWFGTERIDGNKRVQRVGREIRGRGVEGESI